MAHDRARRGGFTLRSVSLLVLMALAAGCAGSPSPAVEELPSDPEDAAPPGFLPNLYLIDAPRPMGRVIHEGAEPMILADRDGPYVWIGSVGGASRSFNGGDSWERMQDPFYIVLDGWALAQDETGDLYAATTGGPYVEVYRSEDDGRTWRSPGTAVYQGPGAGTVDVGGLVDRPWLAARGNGEVALTYWDYGKTLHLACARTVNGGVSWLDRDPQFGSPPVSGRPIYADDGTLAYTTRGGKLQLYREKDALGSLCRDTPQQHTMFPETGRSLMLDTDFENATYFSTAAGPENAGVLLAGWKPGLPGARAKVIDVAPPELLSNAMPTLSAHGDEIAIAWYGTQTPGDFQDPGFAGSWNVFVARVRGFWTEAPTLEIVRVTTEPNHVGDICFDAIACSGGQDRDLLDYMGIDHDRNGVIHVAYTHDGTGTDSVIRYARIT